MGRLACPLYPLYFSALKEANFQARERSNEVYTHLLLQHLLLELTVHTVTEGHNEKEQKGFFSLCFFFFFVSSLRVYTSCLLWVASFAVPRVFIQDLYKVRLSCAFLLHKSPRDGWRVKMKAAQVDLVIVTKGKWAQLQAHCIFYWQ